MARISVDMSTLPGWENLASGSHTLTIKAKADGYEDSDPSAGVEVTKSTQKMKGAIKRVKSIESATSDSPTFVQYNGAIYALANGSLNGQTQITGAIPTVESIESATSDSPTFVQYNGAIYALVEGNNGI